MGGEREAELAGNLASVQARIDGACATAGRDPGTVTIVAITKTRPASDVHLLAELGVRHVGENRDQEAREKAAACTGLGLTWHFVGQLQRNKAASVARYADIVESVDRPSLVAALDRAAEQTGRRLGVCLQVDLDGTALDTAVAGPGRGGARPADILGLADQVAQCGSLDLLGLMAVAPLGEDPRSAFDLLVGIHEQLLTHHQGASMRSAGMSGDLEPAIAAGATHVRLGSALLGHREPLK
ncbi:MAG TPA: YggS family pyridoxal phosphate-dependent enzyme [Motilibacterales bacterium]|nr:YggS family pyridoxal phosphate-dependent enzyme [Motilibacterales bacterium]